MFRKRLPIRYLTESNQGLSHARNRALHEATGDLLVFTDDDVRPCRNWLASYATANRTHSRAEYFGAPIFPWWPSGQPSWARDVNMPVLAGLFGCYDLGPQEQEYSTAEMHPYGANFALRRSLFERLKPFRTDLGVVGAVPGRGEEAEYFHRARAEGASGVYLPTAVVEHRVDARRLTIPYLYRYGVQKGIASRLMQRDRTGATPRFSALPEAAYAIKALFQFAKGRGDRARQCIINMGLQRGFSQGGARKGEPGWSDI